MDHYIADKVVVVTGGTSGLGLEAARILLEMDAKVVVTGRNRQRLAQVQATLDHENLLAVRADATKTADWKRLISKVLTRFGCIDVLVNNHGAGVKIAEIEKLDDKTIMEIMNVNIISVIKGCREVIKAMKPRHRGHIVNVSSACAYHSWPQWAVYTAAKDGLVGFTRCLHLEMTAWGGKATSFVPGAARTSFCANAGIDGRWLAGHPNAHDFSRTLVHCIDIPDNSFIEEVNLWGTRQVKNMLNPF